MRGFCWNIQRSRFAAAVVIVGSRCAIDASSAFIWRCFKRSLNAEPLLRALGSYINALEKRRNRTTYQRHWHFIWDWGYYRTRDGWINEAAILDIFSSLVISALITQKLWHTDGTKVSVHVCDFWLTEPIINTVQTINWNQTMTACRIRGIKFESLNWYFMTHFVSLMDNIDINASSRHHFSSISSNRDNAVSSLTWRHNAEVLQNAMDPYYWKCDAQQLLLTTFFKNSSDRVNAVSSLIWRHNAERLETQKGLKGLLTDMTAISCVI